MQFPVGRSDVVRAINQRWLLKFWKRNLGLSPAQTAVPLWTAVEAEDLSRVGAGLSFLEVSRGADTERYIIRANGPTIARVYGKTDCSGKFLDEVVPQHRYAEVRAPYRQTVHTRCPVYTIHDVTDSSGRVVHYERLLLPFSSGGTVVDRILASFELVCADGAFDGHELMTKQTTGPALRLSATIEPQAMA